MRAKVSLSDRESRTWRYGNWYMVLYGGLAVPTTGTSTMHATSPTKAGESHTITYFPTVSFVIYLEKESLIKFQFRFSNDQTTSEIVIGILIFGFGVVSTDTFDSIIVTINQS